MEILARPTLALGLVLAAACSDVSGATGPPPQACHANPAGDDDAGDAGDDDDDAGAGSACRPGDADGVNGGCYAFALTVSDTGFSPIILKAQNAGQVTVTLRNTGTSPHGFTVGCIDTSGLNGCPAQTCFPGNSSIPAVAPGASASATFVTPNPEGIYVFRSEVPGDSQVAGDGGVSGLWGQFVVQ